MHGTNRARILPPLPPVAKFVVLGLFIAFAAYMVAFLERSGPNVPEVPEPPPPNVAVPQLDPSILAKAHDGSREERLLMEVEPLRHLLAIAIDVTPTVATALGASDVAVPLGELRANRDQWRGRWLRYSGVLEEVGGPRPGHPTPGRSIYEATVKLPDGEHVLAAFSEPPSSDIAIGGWVRVEGFLMKLRDTTYPRDIAEAPMLVGRALELDYQQWGKVTELDQDLLGKIDDQQFWLGALPFHTLEEDQTEALWHLAAYVRDTRDRMTAADWRKVGTLNVADAYDRLIDNQVRRGEPMRVFGTLILKRTIAAPPNPAGIKYWTTAFVQDRDFGGHLIPIWVPGRVDDVPLRAALEVRGFYYRWYCYDSEQKRIRVPLFLAANLDLFELKTNEAMKTVSIVLLCCLIGLLLVFWWTQRRHARTALAHAQHLDARRRKRRDTVRGTVQTTARGQAQP